MNDTYLDNLPAEEVYIGEELIYSRYNRYLKVYTAKTYNYETVKNFSCKVNGKTTYWDCGPNEEVEVRLPKLTTCRDMFNYVWTVEKILNMPDTSGVSDFSNMLQQSMVKEFNADMNTENATDFSNMFYLGGPVGELDARTWNTSKVKSMYRMFQYSGVNSLLLGVWDMGSVTNANLMFSVCEIKKVSGLIQNLKVDLDLSQLGGLDKESALIFINGTAEVDTARTLTFNSKTFALLTEEDYAVATERGWTVVG